MRDPDLLAAILADPNDPARWLALAGWYADNGRVDESDAVRVYWPAFRDTLAAGQSLDQILAGVEANAAQLGRGARAIGGPGV